MLKKVCVLQQNNNFCMIYICAIVFLSSRADRSQLRNHQKVQYKVHLYITSMIVGAVRKKGDLEQNPKKFLKPRPLHRL